jgi:hypothetical protein
MPRTDQVEAIMAEPEPAAPKRKLRWYQYSLRTLFVVTTSAGLLLGWIVKTYASLPDGFARNCFLRDVITIGSCGVAAVVCMLLGVALLCTVRSSRMPRISAIAIFVPLSVGFALLPLPLALAAAWLLSQESLFWGDSAFELTLAEICMSWFTGAAVLLFILVICFIRRVPARDGR